MYVCAYARMYDSIENVKTMQVVATRSLTFGGNQRAPQGTSEVGTVIPAMKAPPLAQAKTPRQLLYKNEFKGELHDALV